MVHYSVLLIKRRPASTLFPYTTLFRSTVDVQSGTLTLSGGGADLGATYKGAGTVIFSGGTRTLDATSNIQGNAKFSGGDRKSTRLTSSHRCTSSAVIALYKGTATTGVL